MDELHHHDGLADSRASEHRRFTPLGERREKIDHLNACLECGGRGTVVCKLGGRSVDRCTGHALRELWAVVAYIADHIEKPAKDGISDRDGDWASGGAHRYSASKPGSRLKRNSPNRGFVKVCLHLDHQGIRPIPFDHQRLVDWRQIATLEGDIHNRPANGENCSFRSFSTSWHYWSVLISLTIFMLGGCNP
jgi:hypothetical protein